jgi:YVTN family beta-propeller protein
MASRKISAAAVALYAAAAGAGTGEGPGRFAKDGVVVDFSIERGGVPVSAKAPLLEGDFAEVTFKLTDAASGAPLRAQKPSAWMDIGGGAQGDALATRECKDKIGLYMKGVVGIRPLVDLNGYFVLVLNRDPSITVIDPVVSMTGKTSLYASVVLKKSGADWARTFDHKRLFVTMPLAGEVAVVDTDVFKVTGNVPAGKAPTRAVLQRDGRYLWVGNDTKDAATSGVTVVDAVALKPVAHVATGRGHHEIALSGDDRFAFVTNRDDGTVSVIDVARLAKVKDVKTGPVPISVAFSPLSQAVYVAAALEGKITVLDAARHEVLARIPAKPGLGPMRFSDDGRWGFVVNPGEHAVHVVDAGGNELAHTIPVDGKPYQVSFTPTYGYVRLLDSERVSMISVASLGAGKRPSVQSFAAGTGVPQGVPDLSLAESVSRATTENAVFVVDPVENSTYFYMEGMNAPSGSFANYGHQGRAVTVVDRSLKEVEPGLYSGKLRVPAAGRYDVAFLLDNPRLLHCFSAEAKENPALQEKLGKIALEFLEAPPRAAAGTTLPVRVKLTDPRTHAARTGLRDVKVLHYRAPGRDRTEVLAREVGGGVYEAPVRLGAPGAYYLYVSVPSLRVRADELPFRSVIAAAGSRTAAAGAGGSR